ncbi:MAG TPA: MarR family transcriptional regulator [Jatrophihabitans sp.]|jgi:DNA-binding MarR family transcriptional regulator|nr:MarR family transcriptional regulator [Jatrophihabitans sp.]
MNEATVAAARWLTAREQTAWRAYLDMNAKLAAKLNREMQQQSGISIADYSVLVQLSEHVDSRMRVLELARALGWEKSRLSHQLTRMQQRGLVERSFCTEDRRGAFILLTDKGRETVVAAAPLHVESVRRYLFDELSAEQVDALGSIARKVADLVDAACAEPADACDETCE